MLRAIAALLLLSRVAAADMIIAPTKTCAPSGAVWVELVLTDPTPRSVQASVKLYANGATQVTRRRGDKQAVVDGRCIPAREMETISSSLKGAAWKRTRSKPSPTCKPELSQSVVVRIFGQRVFTARPCATETLDEKSAALVEALKAKLPQFLDEYCEVNALAKGCV